VSSALAFSLGAGIPLLTAALTTDDSRITITLAVVTASLAGLGWTAAKYGRAEKTRPTIRVVAGGVIAMGITIGIGQILGATIA
jgi:VIT1/CCC1 family predicted Fe2+/Mn2+ transporter